MHPFRQSVNATCRNGIAHTMLAAQFSNWRSGLGLLEDDHELAVGKA